MITKFDSSYYGTADMENLGYTGTPINDRRGIVNLSGGGILLPSLVGAEKSLARL